MSVHILQLHASIWNFYQCRLPLIKVKCSSQFNLNLRKILTIFFPVTRFKFVKQNQFTKLVSAVMKKAHSRQNSFPFPNHFMKNGKSLNYILQTNLVCLVLTFLWILTGKNCFIQFSTRMASLLLLTFSICLHNQSSIIHYIIMY